MVINRKRGLVICLYPAMEWIYDFLLPKTILKWNAVELGEIYVGQQYWWWQDSMCCNNFPSDTILTPKSFIFYILDMNILRFFQKYRSMIWVSYFSHHNSYATCFVIFARKLNIRRKYSVRHQISQDLYDTETPQRIMFYFCLYTLYYEWHMLN